jgi:4-diphosphocytidyl-2-C-methyl-D-erythritol kinase
VIPDQATTAVRGAPLIERARAKVNLTLRIFGRRPDGYHELESLVAFADEADMLTLTVGMPAGLTIGGPMAAGLTANADNLVLMALARAAARFPGLQVGHVTLAKQLPLAAGVGGGSADAGAMLRLLRRANPGTGCEADWLALATSLGADVPVCFADQAATMTGIGATLAPLGHALELSALLVNPMATVPANKTAAVFNALGTGPVRNHPSLAEAPFTDLATAILIGVNDLEAPATRIMPVIAEVIAALQALPGTRAARLSGAGPTCFALFETHAAAELAKNTLSALHARWWIKATRLT